MKQKTDTSLALDFYRATLMLLADSLPSKVDVVFFHARSYGDEDGLFELIENLYKEDTISNVLILGTDGRREGGTKPGESWPGRDVWTKRLQDLGIINRVYLSDEAHHSRSESDVFLKKAREQGWKSAIVLTQPHQILRVILGTIKSMSESNNWIRIYALTPKSTSWEKKVFGSQGKKLLQRFEHIKEEFVRISRYQKLGQLAKFQELFNYLERRKYYT